MPPVHRRAFMSGALITGLAALSACGRSPASVDEEGRVRLRLALDGRARAAHGGFYHAVASGAYAARNLNVQILPAEPEAEPARRLASGTAELGLAADSFGPLDLVAEGAPVKAVAAFLQKSPLALIAPPGVETADMEDLAGRPFPPPEEGDSEGPRDGLWAWLAAEHGFTDEQRVEAAEAQAIRAADLTGETPPVTTPDARLLLASDAGYPSYGGLLLATNAFARDNAATLRSFIAASAEGWRDYLTGDPAAADTAIMAHNPDMSAEALQWTRQQLRRRHMVQGGDAAVTGIGAMTEARWQRFFDIMAGAGFYAPGLDWREAFTLDHLPGRG